MVFSMNFKIKGAFKRAKLEHKYYTSKNWSFKDTGEFWDRVKDYDEIDEETYAYKRRFYDSIKLCSIKPKSKILDIDCRTANGTVFYHKNRLVQEAVCVSPSKNFLNVAKLRLKKYKIKSKTLLLKKIPLNIKSESFDAVLCFETIEHISNKDHLPFLKELNRLLKKDGELILTMPNILWEPIHWLVAIFDIHHSEGPHNFLPRKKIIRLLKKSGFKIKKEKTTVLIPSGPRFLTRFGEIIENLFGEHIIKPFGLRRIFICRKN